MCENSELRFGVFCCFVEQLLTFPEAYAIMNYSKKGEPTDEHLSEMRKSH